MLSFFTPFQNAIYTFFFKLLAEHMELRLMQMEMGNLPDKISNYGNWAKTSALFSLQFNGIFYDFLIVNSSSTDLSKFMKTIFICACKQQ